MKSMNSIKWGLVTFAGCITCAVVAHYLPEPMGPIATVLLAGGFSIIGAVAVSIEQREY